MQNGLCKIPENPWPNIHFMYQKHSKFYTCKKNNLPILIKPGYLERDISK